MPTVKNVGEPCAGEPHARFDGGREETSDSRPRRATSGASRLPDQPPRALDVPAHGVIAPLKAIVAHEILVDAGGQKARGAGQPLIDQGLEGIEL
jgi:hypothetical protein